LKPALAAIRLSGDLPPSPVGKENEGEGSTAAARNACHNATNEQASAEDRMEAAAALAKRCLKGNSTRQ